MHFALGGLMQAEFSGGRAYSCAGGLGDRISSTLPHYLPSVRALELPAVQVRGCGGPPAAAAHVCVCVCV